MYENLHFSKFNTVVQEGDEVAIYNSFSGALAIFTRDEYDFLSSVADPSVSFIHQDLDEASCDIIDRCLIDNFIVREGSDETSILKDRLLQAKEATSSLTVTILPTLSCNFACPYCFEGLDKHSALMPRNVQERFMSWLEQHSDGLTKLNVTWFGGEPTLGLPVIESLTSRILELCRRKKINYGASIVTNGSTMNLDTARFLSEMKVGYIQLTLDGPKDIHDRARFFKCDGRGSYDTILDNVRAYQAATPIRTIFRINVDTNNKGHCFRLIDDLAVRLKGVRDTSVYFAPIHASTEMCEHISGFTLEALHYAELETRLIEYSAERGLMGVSLPNMNMGVCAAARKNGMVLSPNGDIHKCWETVTMDRYRIGNIMDTDFDLHRRGVSWTGWTPFQEKECFDCPILPNCMGMCTYRFLFKENYSGNSAKTPCPPLRFNIQDKIRMFIKYHDKK